MSFRITMLPADQGDALWIEYGDPERPRRILFDVGTPSTWEAVRARIADLAPDERHFELLVVSHIDSDHIGGSLPLLEDESLGVTFGDVWFNGWRHLAEDVQTMGPDQGNRLTDLLANLPWNEHWDGKAVVVPKAGPRARTLEGGFKLTVLSPWREQLLALRSDWPEVVKAHGLVEGEPATAGPELGPPGVQALGPAVPATPADLTDIPAVAARTFDEDLAKPNGSSIAVLAEYDDRAVLLSADAHPSVLARGVKALLADRDEEKLRLEAFKLPHHGSKANLDLALLNLIDCDRHLVSTDGTQTHHPNVEAIARVLVTSRDPVLYFNYSSIWNEVWSDPDVIERGGYEPVFPPAGVVVEIS